MASGQARSCVQLTHDLDGLITVSANNVQAIQGLTAEVSALNTRVDRVEKSQKGLLIGCLLGNPILGIAFGGLDL